MNLSFLEIGCGLVCGYALGRISTTVDYWLSYRQTLVFYRIFFPGTYAWVGQKELYRCI